MTPPLDDESAKSRGDQSTDDRNDDSTDERDVEPADAFGALSDPVRVDILRALADPWRETDSEATTHERTYARRGQRVENVARVGSVE